MLPGPQLPAHTANLPVRWASAPAVNAAASSCLTPIQLMFCRNANRICNSVERVAWDSIDPLDTGFSQNVNQQLGHCFSRHIHPSLTSATDRPHAIVAP